MKWIMLVVVAALSGCASMSNPNMSPEQLKQLVADKNAFALCTTVTTMGGTGKVVSVNLDKTAIPNGSITVNADCVVTITTEQMHANPKVTP